MFNLRVCVFVILGIISSIFLVPITLVLLVMLIGSTLFFWIFVVPSMLIGSTLFFWIIVVPSMLIGGTLTILWYSRILIQKHFLTRTFRGSIVSMLLYILFPKRIIHIYPF